MALERAQSHANGFDPLSGITTCPDACSSFWLVSGDVWEHLRRALGGDAATRDDMA
jgi:hypothetical protein